jgi:hypothetical protein
MIYQERLSSLTKKMKTIPSQAVIQFLPPLMNVRDKKTAQKLI